MPNNGAVIANHAAGTQNLVMDQRSLSKDSFNRMQMSNRGQGNKIGSRKSHMSGQNGNLSQGGSNQLNL